MSQELDWARALRMAASAASLTQQDLAERAGIARSHLHTLKASKPTKAGRQRHPSIPTLLRIAITASVSLSTLVAWAEGDA